MVCSPNNPVARLYTPAVTAARITIPGSYMAEIERGRLERVWLLSTVAVVAAVSLTSTIDIWGAGGALAHGISVLYALCLLAAAKSPVNARYHTLCLAMALVWWLGRGVGFGVLAAGGATNLWGSVLRDGLGGATAYGILHYQAIRRAVLVELYLREQADPTT